MTAMRWLRAALLAVVGTVTGVLAHVGGAGMLPGPAALLGLCVVLTLACAVVLRATESSAVLVVLLLVAGQTFIHGALAAMAGHQAHGHQHGAHEATGSESRMMLAHLAAAAVVGCWIAYGEAALFRVVALALTTFRLLLLVLTPEFDEPCVLSSAPIVPQSLHGRLDGRVLARRGPPARLLMTA